MKFVYGSILLIWLLTATESAFSLKINYLRFLKVRAFRIIDDSVGKNECANNLKSFVADLAKFKNSWALKMLDASAKPQTGLLTGNIYQFGNFDECIAIKADRGKYGTIAGQYCTVFLVPSQNYSADYSRFLNITTLTTWSVGKQPKGYQYTKILKNIKSNYGICIPKSCNAESLQEIWDHLERLFKLPAHATFNNDLCTYKGKVALTYPFDGYIFLFFAVIASLILLSTMYDLLVHQYLDDPGINVWVSFSVYTNLKNLLRVSDPPSHDLLSCVAGLKVISMLWVVLGHRYIFSVLVGNVNANEIFLWNSRVASTLILAAPFSVDTFLLLSGLLLCRGYLKSVAASGRVSYVAFYAHRLLRLWPGLIACVLFNLGVIKYLNDGPFWATLMHKACIEHSWYLAVDMQLYTASPLIMVNLCKYPKATAFAALCACALSAVYNFVTTMKYQLGCDAFDFDIVYFDYIYQPTYARLCPWVFGVLLGYVLFNVEQVKVPKGLAMLMWTLAFTTISYLIYVHNIIESRPYDDVAAAIFNSCARPAWSVAISVIVFMCATGNGGLVQRFLSAKIFRFTSRISYSVFLVHIFVLMYISGGVRTISYFSNFTVIYQYFGDLFFIFVAALVWYAAFEAPFLVLAKIVFTSGETMSLNIAVSGRKLTRRQRRNRNLTVCILNEKKFL
ncbi:O-acyltransferase like protein-like isoform X2 [Cylas formicarius]|uniref:O-acyltransferase like protein-like isoform X2 n=1 Tax=Cylas formicarius TaxID=197179 RepID=UPI002958513F|nr:O-acyltransferase like protein-like isoform X2 [Cylas formicarius]